MSSLADERRLLDLLEQALDQPREQQKAFVTAALENEPRLLMRAHAMLSDAHTRATHSADDVSLVASAIESLEVAHRLPDTLGAYKVVALLGEGGMGRVYLAARNDGAFDKQVAIKIVQSHRGDKLLQQRFEAERQILANLTHPNIAALLDGGWLEDGTPYLVMEYVDGVQIDEYVARSGLNITDTVKLFLQVCEAVQAAHQSLVVHRDIKPSNILVEEGGQAKLIDFGIAKDLAGVVGEETQLHGPTALTSDYASPEQFERKPVTTATDVYGLGILLFKLISGCKPYSTSNMSFGEIKHLVVDQPAPAMRDAVSHAHVAGVEVPFKRDSIPRELELIVAKAIAKEPDRRYATALELSDDLAAYLSGRPVQASGDSWAYRASKFARRHWVGLAATTAVVASLLGGIAVTILQSRATAEAAARSDATAAFLSKILLAPSARAESDYRLGSNAQLSELLNQAAAELLANDGETGETAPSVRANLMLSVARTYHGLAMYNEALELLDVAQSICAVNDCDRNDLGARINFRKGQSLTLIGKPEPALELFRTAASATQDVLLRAQISDESASAIWSLGDREATVAAMEQAVALYEEAAGAEPDLLVAVSYTRLGGLYSNMGRLDDGLATLERGAALYEQLGQTALPELGDLYLELSNVYWKRGDSKRKLEELEKAHAVFQNIDGVSEMEIRVLMHLGVELLKAHSDTAPAREVLAEAKSALEEFAVDNEPHEAKTWVNHIEAKILVAEENYEEALVLFENQLEAQFNLMPSRNHAHAGTEQAIAGVLTKLNRLEEALRYEQRILRFYSEIYATEESLLLTETRQRVAELEARMMSGAGKPR